MEQDGLHGARPCAYVVLPSSYAIDDAGRTPHEGPREASIITEEINQAACPLFLSNVSIHVHTSRLERTYNCCHVGAVSHRHKKQTSRAENEGVKTSKSLATTFEKDRQST